MIHILLFEPEIPQNTGNIARSCALCGATLHLIGPLGFSLSEKKLRRAGLDYWDKVDLICHDTFADYRNHYGEIPLYLITTRGERVYSDVPFERDAAFLFGSESRGLPESIHEAYAERRLVIPMRSLAGLRSLNLSNSVAVVLYEWWRQGGFCDD